MSEKSFEKDFNLAMELINKENNLTTIEKIAELYIASNPNYSPSIFIDFQIQLFGVFREYTGVIMHFLKTPEQINYTGKNREQFRRLQNLKKLTMVHLNNMDQALSSPNKLKGNMFSYNDLSPFEISGTLVRFDGEYFKFSFDINDGINLSKSIIENLNQKFTQGKNNVNVNDYSQLREAFEILIQNMDKLIAQEDSIETPIEEGI